MQISPGSLDSAFAGSGHWAPRTSAQDSSAAGQTSSWQLKRPEDRKPESHGTASSSGTNTLLRASSPRGRGRGTPAVAMTPGFDVSSPCVQHPDLSSSRTPEMQAKPQWPCNSADALLQQEAASKQPALHAEWQHSEHHDGGLKALSDKGNECHQPAKLPPRAQRAARLHSALIRHTASVQLAAELESLLRLLTMPDAAQCAVTDDSTLLLPSGEAAAQYAC